MFVLKSPRFLKYFTFNFAIAIALYLFIIVKSKSLKENTQIIQHEKIHLKQQLELLIIFFYVWYIVEYLIRLWQYKNHYKAYSNISFEKEAYQNDGKKDYLAQRKCFAFLRYL